MGNDNKPKQPKGSKSGAGSASGASGGGDGSLTHIRPSAILYTHSKIRPSFSGCGRTLQQTLDQIVAGELSPHDLPPIAVISEILLPTKEDGDGEDDWSEDDEDGGGRGKRGKRGGGGKGKRGGGGGGGVRRCKLNTTSG